MLKALFVTCPMSGDMMNMKQHKGKLQLDKMERIYQNFGPSCFGLIATDYDNQQDDPVLYPGRMSLEDMKKIPPVVIYTSEYDFLRREALQLVEDLRKAGKYLDHHDLPGVEHGFQINHKNW